MKIDESYVKIMQIDYVNNDNYFWSLIMIIRFVLDCSREYLFVNMGLQLLLCQF